MTKKSDAPAIRFKGFSDAWEQRKLGDIASDMVAGGDIDKDLILAEGQYPVIANALTGDGIVGYYDKEYRVNAPAVTVTGRGDVGHAKARLVNFTPVVRLLSVKSEHDVFFLENAINTLKIVIESTGVPQLTVPQLAKYEVAFPRQLDEEEHIGVFFKQLDHLITLHQRKFEKLTNVKKSMLEKMFPQNGSSYPEIRFKGFTDPWEQRKLGDIADIVGGGTPSTGNQSYWDGDIDWYAPAEIADQIYANSSQKKITGLGYENSSAKMLPPGTVLFTSRAGIGKTAILTRKGCTNQGFQSIVPHRGELDSYFIFSRTEELKRYGELVGAGSTFVEVSGKQMAVMELMMPPTMREQQTIGGFFQQLDHLITLHQRKCALLFSPFQAFISMMFITSTFSWEQRKLGDMMNVTSVKRIHQSDWTDSGVRFLRARDIVAAAKNEEPDDYLYISKEKYEEYSTLSGKVGVSDLLVTGVGTIGVPYLVRNLEPLYFKDGNIIWFQNSDKIDGKFLFYSFSAEQIQGFINESAGIGTVGTYTIESGKKTPISLPNQIEQAKVGEFFQQLDNLITLHQRKCIFFTGRAGRLISTVNKKRITSSWEQREVGDLLIERSQQAPMSDEYPLMAFIANEGVAPKGERYDRSALVTDTVNKLYKKTEKGDFIYSSNNLETGSIGLNKYGKACISPVYSIFEPTGIADSDFLGRRLVRKDFINAMVKWRQGVIYGQWRIHESDFLKIEISVPSVEEQRKIGAYLDQLDNLITLHQRKPFLMKWRTSDANRNQTNRLVL